MPVKALVCPNTAQARINKLLNTGATITPVNLSDVESLTIKLEEVMDVIFILQGLKDVIHVV